MMICTLLSGLNLNQAAYYAVVFLGFLSASKQIPGEHFN
jgi:hypothetical protein